MPFALLAIGILLVIAAYNNTQTVLANQLKTDFSGSTGFVYWIAAILIIGVIGYIKPMQTVSRAMLALVLVVIFLSHSGFFGQFNSALAGSSSGDSSAKSDNKETNNSSGMGMSIPLIPDLNKMPTLGGTQ